MTSAAAILCGCEPLEVVRLAAKVLPPALPPVPKRLHPALQSFLHPAGATGPASGTALIYSRRTGRFAEAAAKEVSGRRLVVGATDMAPSEMLSPKVARALEAVAVGLSCDLVQLYLAPGDFGLLSRRLPPGFYAANFLFQSPVAGAPIRRDGGSPVIEPIRFLSHRELSFHAEADLLIRRMQPGSTVESGDRMSAIWDEFRDARALCRQGILRGLRTRGSAGAFILWYENSDSRTALVSNLYVPPQYRGRGWGRHLLRAARHQMRGRIDRFNYFVSALNIASMRALSTAGFKLDNVVINMRTGLG